MIEQIGDNLIPVLAISCTFLFFVIWIIAATIESLYKTRTNAQLKQRLIDRGASASEIDRVLKAGTNEDWTPAVPPTPPVKSYT